VPDIINIARRPQAGDRATPRRWEGDLLIGNKKVTAIGTRG